MATPTYECPYNEAIDCDKYKQRPCHNCGWNPKVAKERLEEYCKKHGIVPPKRKEDERM